MITHDSSLEDVCFSVSGALQARGISGVLTGGSAAAVYVPIGFRRDGRSRIFYHPESKFTVDFPKGPLAVAGDYVSRTNVLSRGGGSCAIGSARH